MRVNYSSGDYTRYKIGVVANDTAVNVYQKPTHRSSILQTLCYMSKVRISEPSSTKDFYKVCTENGTEGFCEKRHVDITEI